MFFTTLFLVRILCWGLMTPRLKSLTPEWPRLTRPRPPSCFVMRRILIPDLKHGIKHLRHDVNCENAFYRHPLESWGQIRTLANILGYHWPVSRLQTGPGDTTWPVHQHQSGRVPGLSSQTVRATYFVQTERGSGDPAWGGKSGSWKLRRAIKLVTQRAMGPELMCRVWRVGKFRNSLLRCWILNIVSLSLSRVGLWRQRETGPGSNGLWPLKHWLADPRIFRKSSNFKVAKYGRVLESFAGHKWFSIIISGWFPIATNVAVMQHDAGMA